MRRRHVPHRTGRPPCGSTDAAGVSADPAPPALAPTTALCRLCLDSTATTSIFASCTFDRPGATDAPRTMSYSEQIMRCARVQVSPEDGLPRGMCAACEAELSLSYRFALKVEAADDALRRLQLSGALLGDALAGLSDDAALPIKREADSDDHLDCGDVKDEPFDQGDVSEANFEAERGRSRKRRKERVERLRKKLSKREKLGPIQCPTCGLLANSRSAMDIHVRTHTGERPYACNLCDSAYTTKGTLKRHIETHHMERERKFTCETCGNRFYRKNDIIIHMRRHTGETPYACPFCPKRFQQIASLIRHKRTHTGDKPYSCPVCAKPFADKSMVTKHLSVHSDVKKYNCHLCEKSMKSKSALANHLNLHSNEKLNVCNFCGMAFAAKGNLKVHILRVHSEKSGQCNVCLKTFSNLEVHMVKHTGEKPFECNICNRSFGTKKSLSNHVIFKHENASKYKCSVDECTKMFPTPSMLEFHLLKQHTNQTPFVCQYCSRGFFRCSDLSRHLRVSHVEQHAVVEQLRHPLNHQEPLKQEIRLTNG